MDKHECCEQITKRSEEFKKKLFNRINRLKGQIEGVSRMIEEDRYCKDILIQLSAIEKSTKSLASLIFDNHMHSCVVNGLKNGDETKINEVVELFRRFS